ncbi:hypothetical protein B0E50_00490 [Rhodanobacter sp. C01]|nr:hypothetical protein B0E50_00490 [Rhodanobacter sp. C01]
MSLDTYLRLCGVREMDSDKIFFSPNIPAKKLDGALRSIGHLVKPQDILVVIDDTVFGGAKEGLFITNSAIYVKEPFTELAVYPMNSIGVIRAENTTIYINDDKVVSLTQPEKMPLGWLFSQLDDFVRSDNWKREKVEIARWIPWEGLQYLCEDFLTISTNGETKPISSIYIGDRISPDMALMAHFSMGMADDEAIIAVSDLTLHDGHARVGFALTTAGIRAKSPREPIPYPVFIPYAHLADVPGAEDFQESIYQAVRLSNHRTIICTRIMPSHPVPVAAMFVKLAWFCHFLLNPDDYDDGEGEDADRDESDQGNEERHAGATHEQTNFYDILGVRPSASVKEIELAYRARRAQYHPDKYATEDRETIAWATRMMQQVNDAYAKLTN